MAGGTFFSIINFIPKMLKKINNPGSGNLKEKINGKTENIGLKAVGQFAEKPTNNYEINSLQWDEYGNPYIYTGPVD